MGSRVSREEFEWVYTDQPHAARRKEILGEDWTPLCARGRVRALSGLPCAPCERGLRGPFQPLRCLAAGAGSGRAGEPRDEGSARRRSLLALRWPCVGGLRRPVS